MSPESGYPEHSWLSRGKWPLLAGYWLLQGGLIYVIWAAWIILNASSGGSAGPLYGFDFADFARLVVDPEWAFPALGGVGLFTLLQGLLLLPVAKPRADFEAHGVSLWVSAAAAAGAVALMWGAVVGAVFGAIQLSKGTSWGSEFGQTAIWVIIGSIAVSWIAATPLVFAFVARGRRESTLSRLAAAIFLGTAVEAVAVLPLDVMMRRKTDCYCDTGTFWALSACGTVGLFTLGPAIFLPLLARRRRRWYASRCDACGYDMSATPNAPRCPECGAGWRMSTK